MFAIPSLPMTFFPFLGVPLVTSALPGWWDKLGHNHRINPACYFLIAGAYAGIAGKPDV